MRIDLMAIVGIIGTIWLGIEYSVNPFLIAGLVLCHILAFNIKVN